jgi:plasmid stabilization system protein ParE
MRIVYLASCTRDLAWWRHYYSRVFPEGAAGARDRILANERLLLDHPHAGRPTHRPDVRRLAIPRTPFVVFYRLRDQQIEVLRLIDARAFDSMLED